VAVCLHVCLVVFLLEYKNKMLRNNNSSVSLKLHGGRCINNMPLKEFNDELDVDYLL